MIVGSTTQRVASFDLSVLGTRSPPGVSTPERPLSGCEPSDALHSIAAQDCDSAGRSIKVPSRSSVRSTVRHPDGCRVVTCVA
jgi:hypothetical protein